MPKLPEQFNTQKQESKTQETRIDEQELPNPEQVKSLQEAAERARQEEEKNSEEITDLKKELDGFYNDDEAQVVDSGLSLVEDERQEISEDKVFWETPEGKQKHEEIARFLSPHGENEFTAKKLKLGNETGLEIEWYEAETKIESEESPDGIGLKMVLYDSPPDSADDIKLDELRVGNMEIDFGDKKYNLDDFGIDGKSTVLKIVPSRPEGEHYGVCHLEKDKGVTVQSASIETNSLCSAEDLAVIFHEVGHFKDYQKRPEDVGECLYSPYEMAHDQNFAKLPEKQIASAAKLLVNRERNAWAEALRSIKSLGMPIEKATKKEMDYALGTYDIFATMGVGGRAELGHFASDKKRGEARRVKEAPRNNNKSWKIFK